MRSDDTNRCTAGLVAYSVEEVAPAAVAEVDRVDTKTGHLGIALSDETTALAA